MSQKPTGAQIRQTFIDFFVEQKHTFVPSASLVPGGDSTLLFTNAGMVQFKDVFLGTDKRPYTRAVDSQKVLRVSGKHNDLDEVGRDDTHHTFFEMLGNWSFGDYYKKEAITWAWQLLTDVWGLPKERVYATCFKDDKGNIPTDDEAADIWKEQPGFDPSHALFFGRKENFWEMAETGPCGPCSEIHLDRGEEFDNLAGKPHRCGVNGECQRYLELWNNVFIQYNRIDEDTLEPLPARHVDTGMGFERLVSVLQGVDSDYKIDLFQGALAAVRQLTGDSQEKMLSNFTPYRVIADHSRAAAFLIADGVVPGNKERNYICRMIIRRAARFGTKLGLHEPFLGKVADAFVAAYGDFYPELVKSRDTILDNLTREETRFARTIESGTAYLQEKLDALQKSGGRVLDGGTAFDLYGTYGLPLEISRDIAREQGLDVDVPGFRAAREAHSVASGGGKAMGKLSAGDAEFYTRIMKDLQLAGKIGREGVVYNPYDWLQVEAEVLSMASEGQALTEAGAGDQVEILLPKTGFYVESGGQVSDTGFIRALDGSWEVEVTGMRKPSPSAIIHMGEVVFGHPRAGDAVIAAVDEVRRHDIRRNHTATHLLHAALHQVLGENARQAGSLVSPDRFRFDFNHPEAMTAGQVEQVEKLVNDAVAADYPVNAVVKPREEAVAEGAMALFGEKYGDSVRTITIGEKYSYELCGGTHLDRTSDVGAFLIISEGSAAAGVRRIEAVTGRGAYELIARRFKMLKQTANALKSAVDEVPQKAESILEELSAAKKEISSLTRKQGLEKAPNVFQDKDNAEKFMGITIVAADFGETDYQTLQSIADKFREEYKASGGTIIATGTFSNNPIVITSSTDNVLEYGLDASELAKVVGEPLGGSGGGRSTLARAGGKDASRLQEAREKGKMWIKEKILKNKKS